MSRTKRIGAASALIAVIALVTTACTSATTTNSTSHNPTGTAAANAPAADTSAPTKISITAPLPGKVQPKKVAWMACELPACQVYTNGFKTATAALGWKLQVFPLDQTNPGAGLQAAINAGVDYIAVNSVSPAAIKPQIAEAKAKGIVLFNCFDTTAPNMATNDEYINCGDGNYLSAEGAQLANWIINDSGGSAHVLTVNVPSIPILNSMADGAKKALAACSGCSSDHLDLAVTDIGGGAIPGKVVNYLQTHPQINYVLFSFADLATGVEQALRQAGLGSKVKITGISANSNALSAVADGSNAAWTIQPTQSVAWVMVDAMARYQLGVNQAKVQAACANLQSFVVDSKDVAQRLLKEDGGSWPGPAGYQDQFKSLWGLG